MSYALRLAAIVWVNSRLLIVLYGLVFALGTAAHLNANLPAAQTLYLQGDRLEGAQRAIAGISHGLPPLIGAAEGNQVYVVGLADDPGYYVYIPYLTHWTGQSDPRVALRWSFIVLFALLIGVLPWAFYEITGSLLAGLLAPVIVYSQFHFLENTDVYWINGWVVLMLMPLVFAAYKRTWTWRSVVLLTAVSVVASFATSIRLHSGLPVALAAIVVGVLRQPGRLAKLGVVVLVATGYLSIYPAAFQPIFAARDRGAAAHGLAGPAGSSTSVSAIYPHTHLTWHNAYIGLGYVPNDYAIVWSDAASTQEADRIDPGVMYLSKHYDLVMRHLFFTVIRDDPGLLWRNIVLKTQYELGQALRRFGWTLVLLPLIFGLGRRRRREFGLYLALSVPALVITLGPPVLTVPALFYSVGFFAAAGLYWLLAATWFVGVTAPELTRRGATWSRAESRTTRDVVRALATWRNALVAGLTLAAVVAVHERPPISYKGFTDKPLPTSLALSAPLRADAVPGRALQAWNFEHGLPGGWRVGLGAAAVPGKGSLNVTTGSVRVAFGLLGPKLSLPRGRYAVELDGALARGGLALGLVDERTGKWIAQSGYSSTQHLAGRRLVTELVLAKPRVVQIVVANYSLEDTPSVWKLRSGRLVAEPGSGA